MYKPVKPMRPATNETNETNSTNENNKKKTMLGGRAEPMQPIKPPRICRRLFNCLLMLSLVQSSPFDAISTLSWQDCPMVAV